jgi:hypothetical protein
MASSQPFRGIVSLNIIQRFSLGRRPFDRNQEPRRRVTTGTCKLASAGITSTNSAVVGSSGTLFIINQQNLNQGHLLASLGVYRAAPHK